MSGKRLTAAERADRIGLRLVRDGAATERTRSGVTRAAGRTAFARLERHGYIVRDPASEYTDVLALTFDGADYLEVLEETWHD